jgi:hypothetical protein
VVASCGGDFQGSLAMALASHIRQIEVRRGWVRLRGLGGEAQLALRIGELLKGARQIPGAPHPQSLHQGGLGDIAGGDQ